jgi:hypothetical protein
VGEDGESVAADHGGGVPQTSVHPRGPGFESVRKPEIRYCKTLFVHKLECSSLRPYNIRLEQYILFSNEKK